MADPQGTSQTLNSVLPLDTMYSTVSQCNYGFPMTYRRLNKLADKDQKARLIALGIIGGIGVILYLIALILFIIRRNKQPLRDR
jgi:hypothetical protein